MSDEAKRAGFGFTSDLSNLSKSRRLISKLPMTLNTKRTTEIQAGEIKLKTFCSLIASKMESKIPAHEIMALPYLNRFSELNDGRLFDSYGTIMSIA